MPGWVSPWELLILLAFVLLLFGPKRLPEMGRSLGKGMREFKDSLTGDGDKDEPKPEQLPAAPVAPPDEHPVAAAQARAEERDPTS
jgi:sec-independent protein translocase protein TatA